MFRRFISSICFRDFVSSIYFFDLFQRFRFVDLFLRFVSAISFRRFISSICFSDFVSLTDKQLGIFIFNDHYIWVYQVTVGSIKEGQTASKEVCMASLIIFDTLIGYV